MCGILAAVVAVAKNRSMTGWLLLGFGTGIFGLIAAAGIPALPEPPQTENARKNARKDGSHAAVIVVGILLILGVWVLGMLAQWAA